MDSLLSNYASSDEEEAQQPKIPIPSKNPSSSSGFSTLPNPKSQNPNSQNPKRVVQFTPPVNPYALKPTQFDDEDEEEEKERLKKRQKDSSLSSSYSGKSLLSMIPAPKHSLMLGASSATSSGRRAIVETQTHDAISEPEPEPEPEPESKPEVVDHNPSPIDNASDPYYSYANYDQYYREYAEPGFAQPEPGIGGYAAAEESSGQAWVGVREIGKRGRSEIPKEIVEVKQDELMKNRPREDQAKLTGIAFGPSYQPASTKGKPSKLHKRKHQIGTLYFDMKQKEMELAERRSRGMLSKSETHAKYGW